MDKWPERKKERLRENDKEEREMRIREMWKIERRIKWYLSENAKDGETVGCVGLCKGCKIAKNLGTKNQIGSVLSSLFCFIEIKLKLCLLLWSN